MLNDNLSKAFITIILTGVGSLGVQCAVFVFNFPERSSRIWSEVTVLQGRQIQTLSVQQSFMKSIWHLYERSKTRNKLLLSTLNGDRVADSTVIADAFVEANDDLGVVLGSVEPRPELAPFRAAMIDRLEVEVEAWTLLRERLESRNSAPIDKKTFALLQANFARSVRALSRLSASLAAAQAQSDERNREYNEDYASLLAQARGLRSKYLWAGAGMFLSLLTYYFLLNRILLSPRTEHPKSRIELLE